MKKLISMVCMLAMVLSMATFTIAESAALTDGTYTATAAGFGGDVTVTITVADGAIYKADTLEELAELIGVPAETLVKTVSDYNEYCDTKENPADGIAKNPVLYNIDGSAVEGDYNVYEKVEGDGPYYAVKGSPWVYSTTGALDVNEKFQVLNTNGEAMEGLYAVGTDCLGILFTEKKEYVTYGGADQGWAFTSGYLAGEQIAEELLNK